MRRLTARLLIVLAGLLIPASAFAQASINGAVKDTSGSVLPGVTVEASSPALIEKTRSVVTDGTGQYRIENLRPGTYTVTFALSGFNTSKREGIELTGAFAATVDAELRVGTLEETITVTGETPTVDLQNTTKQRVLDQEAIDTLPTGRTYNSMASLVPGLISSTNDVGGSRNDLTLTFAVHGASGNDSRPYVNGLRLSIPGTTGSNNTTLPNTAGIQEVVVDYGAISAEQGPGGVRINIIPKEGGNQFSGLFFGDYAGSSMQGNNFTQDLKNRGLTTPDSIKSNWDVNPGFGGPIRKDKLWFFGTVRYNGGENYVGGMFYNQNANNPNAWAYVPDTSRPATNRSTWKDAYLRMTWQVNAKNKVAMFYDQQRLCLCLATVASASGATAGFAPEAGRYWYFPMIRMVQAEWSSPLTNRILIEASAVSHIERYIMERPRDLSAAMINVLDQFSNINYRARDTYANIWAPNLFTRGAISYVTGAHALKVGFNFESGEANYGNFDNQDVSYRVNSASGVPVPNQITLRVMPYIAKYTMNADMGIYAQDRWTVGRLTTTAGIRYDHLSQGFPEQQIGPTPLAPTLNVTFPAQGNLNWNDIDPRLGVNYDLFGNGKTAVRASVNRYIQSVGAAGVEGSGPNPINLLVLTTTRSWTDRNGNFVPDCNLLNPAAQTVTNGDICGADANSAFGTQAPGTRYDPNILAGTGTRPYNWEFAAGVQHELIPRVSVDLAYYRRIFGNFWVTDNLTVAPTDYNTFSIAAPVDTRLPGGGGYTIGGLYDLNPAKFGLPSQNFVTLSDNYGKQISHWNGVDLTTNVRLQGTLRLAGGVSTGKTTTDNCDVVSKLDNPSQLYCHVDSGFRAQVKLVAAYTVPKIDVLVSGVLQSLPGTSVAANFLATNAIVSPSLGRPLAGGAANTTVNLVAPETFYTDRRNQLDLRLSKIIKYGRTRTSLNVDFFNVLNANPVLGVNASYAAWLTPTQILTARFMKLGAQINF